MTEADALIRKVYREIGIPESDQEFLARYKRDFERVTQERRLARKAAKAAKKEKGRKKKAATKAA